MLKVERNSLITALDKMKVQGTDYLVKITAVDYVDHIDAIYILRDFETSTDQILEVTLQPNDLWLPTIINIHQCADWYERELSEMFGIAIKGRKASRLLLEKWDGVDPPLRKSFTWYAPYKTIDDDK